MRHYGLIGYRRFICFGEYFAQKFREQGIQDAHFKAYPLQNINSICAFIRSNDLQGFSVTIPYKTAIIPYLDELSETSLQLVQ